MPKMATCRESASLSKLNVLGLGNLKRYKLCNFVERCQKSFEICVARFSRWYLQRLLSRCRSDSFWWLRSSASGIFLMWLFNSPFGIALTSSMVLFWNPKSRPKMKALLISTSSSKHEPLKRNINKHIFPKKVKSSFYMYNCNIFDVKEWGRLFWIFSNDSN